MLGILFEVGGPEDQFDMNTADAYLPLNNHEATEREVARLQPRKTEKRICFGPTSLVPGVSAGMEMAERQVYAVQSEFLCVKFFTRDFAKCNVVSVVE